MDIITQTVLGASVGELVLGKKVGNKAVFWGAITGVIPDLDVLITGFFSEVDGLFVHRGFTHSLIFAFLLAPLLSYLIYKILHKRSLATRKDWFRLVFWSAFTHPILDYFTTYGTGAFAPFSNYRVEFSTIGIVDVFYTLPMILALAVLMFFNRNSKIRRKFIVCVLSLSTFYLLLTVVNKINVNHQFEKGFSNQNINYERIRTNPVPLTNFLWMGIAEVDSGYHVGYYSIFDSNYPTTFEFVKRNEYLLSQYSNDKNLAKLLEFTKSYYQVNRDHDGLYIVDLRFGKMGFGKNASFVFRFNLKEQNNQLIIEQAQRGNRTNEPINFDAFWERLWGIRQ